MLNNAKISVVIPVYNAEKYLPALLHSVVNQTLRQIEIIVVLDCPTDGSAAIAEEFAAADERIKLIYNHENLHIGLTSNLGLAHAAGDYVLLVDHDDELLPTMCQKMYEVAASGGFDVVRCNAIVLKNGRRTKMNHTRKYGASPLPTALWNTLLKNDYLKKNNLWFPDSRTIAPQDLLFSLDALTKTNRIGYCREHLYIHIERHHSDYYNNTSRLLGLEYIYAKFKDDGRLERYGEWIARRMYTMFRFRYKEFYYIHNRELLWEYVCNLFSLRHVGNWLRMARKPLVVVFLMWLRLGLYPKVKIR